LSSEKTFPSDEADKYVVRFPPGMRDALKKAAHANNRTLNAEVVARLGASLEEAPDKGAGLSESEAIALARVALGGRWSNLRIRLAAAQYAGLFQVLLSALEGGQDLRERFRIDIDRARSRVGFILGEGSAAALEFEELVNEGHRLAPGSNWARELESSLDVLRPAIKLIREIDSLQHTVVFRWLPSSVANEGQSDAK
jgi:hypothetical protein